ncbi:MAG: M1 family aminopeptidase [Candidatus Thorarchaeota archaeon]
MPDFHDYLEALMRGDTYEAESIRMAERDQFTFPTAKPQWAPSRQYSIEHLTFEWKMNLEEEHVDAIAILRIKSIVPEISTIYVHAAEMKMSSVKAGDDEVSFAMQPDEESMAVYLKTPLKENDIVELTFTYQIDKPRGGLFFTNPSPEFPSIETSAWTQLQDDYARYIVPVYDNPSHKFPLESIITVPDGFYVMSNGELKERRKNDDGSETFHWVQKLPIPSYLMTVWVSEAVEYKEDLDGLEVSYYAHKKWDKDTIYRSYGKTPEMIKFYESKFGVKYPWVKYAQVTAANFIFGGMENVSATTQTDATFHDDKAHLDFDSDGLVSHELVHQWFGDLVTCRTWSHGWLNEGAATQFQNEWKRHDKGDDEYFYEQYQKQMAYFDEDKNKYRRPVVQNEWERGGDVFDRTLYPGGAWRYYMLMQLVGEEKYWKIIAEYLKRHSFESVYTHNLESIFTEMTGEDFGWFFEQWLYRAGYPECKIKVTYDEKLGQALVKIEQTQKYDDGMTPEVFRFPLKISFVQKDGSTKSFTMQVDERIHSFYFPVKESPKMVMIDPEYAVLMDWRIDKPEPMWIEQLTNGHNVIMRIKAAQALAKKATPKALTSLGLALTEENFWGVQVEIAKVLGSVKNESALDELIKGLDVKNTRSRTAVARALGEFYKSDRAFEALKKLLKDKESYFVVSAAAASVGKIQHEGSFDVLKEGVKDVQPSWHHIVEQGYLQGIAATEKEEAIGILLSYSTLGNADELRRTVPTLLAKLGKRYKKDRPDIKPELEKLIKDGSFRVQVMALLAAKAYEDPSMIPTLSKIAESEVEGRIVRYSREAIRTLSKKREPKEIDSLKKSVEELEKENRDLKDRMAKLEELVKREEE